MVQFRPLFTAQPFNQLNKEVCASHFSVAYVVLCFCFLFLPWCPSVALCLSTFSISPESLSLPLLCVCVRACVCVRLNLSHSFFSLSDPLSICVSSVASVWRLVSGPHTVSVLQVQGHFQSASTG